MSLPRRDIGQAYLNALDQEPKVKADAEVVAHPAGEAPLLAGEGPRQNGVSYGTRHAMRQLLEEAEAQFRSQQKVKPRAPARYPWLAIVAASVTSCALGFFIGRWGDARSGELQAVQTVTIPAGHYFCARCQTTHPKPANAIGNPRTWCPKVATPDAAAVVPARAPTIPDRARQFRSGTRLP